MITTRLLSPHGNMDIFVQDAAIGNKVSAIFESIIQDECEWEGKPQGVPNETGWSCINDIIDSNVRDEYQRMPGITFQQCGYETGSSDFYQYFHFLPYSDYNWTGWNQTVYVEDLHTGLLALDSIIRKCLLVGLICLDIDDMFLVFSSGTTFAFLIESVSCTQFETVMKDILHKKRIGINSLYYSKTIRILVTNMKKSLMKSCVIIMFQRTVSLFGELILRQQLNIGE